MNYNQETVENLIVYKALTQQSFMTLIYEHLDSDLFDKSYNKTVIGLFHKFVKENKKYPKPDELTLIINDDNTKNSFREAIKTYKALDKNISDEVFLPYVEKFLKDKLKFKAIAESVHDYENGQLDNAEVIKRFDKAQNIALISDFGLDYFKNIPERVKRLTEIDQRIPTGFPTLDKKLNGGLLKNGRAIYIFSGAPNAGKSVILGNLCANFLKQNLRISLITLEMSQDIYSQRIDALITGIKINELSSNIDGLMQKLEEYKEINTGSELFIKEFPPQSIKAKQLFAYYQKMIDQNMKPDVVLIDYVNLFAPPEEGLARDERITMTTELLRALSYLSFPVVSLTQNVRSDDVSQTDMNDISEGLGIPRVADFLASIVSEEEDKFLGVMRWKILKSRFGEAFGNITLKMDYGTLRLEEQGDYFSESALDAENKLNQL
jgi:replicative DNA helicase